MLRNKYVYQVQKNRHNDILDNRNPLKGKYTVQSYGNIRKRPASAARRSNRQGRSTTRRPKSAPLHKRKRSGRETRKGTKAEGLKSQLNDSIALQERVGKETLMKERKRIRALNNAGRGGAEHPIESHKTSIHLIARDSLLRERAEAEHLKDVPGSKYHLNFLSQIRKKIIEERRELVISSIVKRKRQNRKKASPIKSKDGTKWISPKKAADLSALKQFRRQEFMHNEHIKSLLETEKQNDLQRQKQIKSIKKSHSSREIERVNEIHKRQRNLARRKISVLNEERQIILEKSKKWLTKQVQIQRAKRIIANKPFREQARRDLESIVKAAKFKTIALAASTNALNNAQNFFFAKRKLQKYVQFGRKKNRARETLKAHVLLARNKLWDMCTEDLFSKGVSKTRMLNYIEYDLQIRPSRERWKEGMLECIAVDTFLGEPYGLIRVHLPMPLQLKMFLEKELPLENTYEDFARSCKLLDLMVNRVRFGRVPESDDPRKLRLEDPANRVQGLSFGLKARGIYRVKSAPRKKKQRNPRVLKHLIIKSFRTPQQAWGYYMKRKKLLPADYFSQHKRGKPRKSMVDMVDKLSNL